MFKIRKAKIEDVTSIHKLVNDYAKAEKMLPRSLNSIYESIRSFVIAEENKKGTLIGCCALQVMWNDLAEIRSLAVHPRYHGKGAGKELIVSCLFDAQELGIHKVFTLTYIPDYFKKFGFKTINKSKLPQKIWTDCINCPHFPDCDEIAMICELKKPKLKSNN